MSHVVLPPASCFVHPKPIKVEPQHRRHSFEESVLSKGRESALEEDKRQEACEALQALKSERNMQTEETSSNSEEKTQQVKQEQRSEASPSCSPTKEERASKRSRKLTYACCLCDHADEMLSSLTSHLESDHGLVDYELIKRLLACLGDIGA